jgi:hypothetical protein
MHACMHATHTSALDNATFRADTHTHTHKHTNSWGGISSKCGRTLPGTLQRNTRSFQAGSNSRYFPLILPLPTSSPASLHPVTPYRNIEICSQVPCETWVFHAVSRVSHGSRAWSDEVTQAPYYSSHGHWPTGFHLDLTQAKLPEHTGHSISTEKAKKLASRKKCPPIL